jgi:hypothetical protein
VILEALGRTDDALRWYRTFPDPNAYDFAYLPAVRARMRHHGAAAGAAPGTSPR